MEAELIGPRLKELRQSVNLTRLKMAELVWAGASSIDRYERNIVRPTVECFLIYADYFDVLLYYIFGRCDEPQGKWYEHCPHVERNNPELKQFVDMCFDPSSPISGRLKKVLTKMMEDSKNDTDLCKRTCVHPLQCSTALGEGL